MGVFFDLSFEDLGELGELKRHKKALEIMLPV